MFMFFKSLHTVTAHNFVQITAYCHCTQLCHGLLPKIKSNVQIQSPGAFPVKFLHVKLSTITILDFEHLLQVSPSLDQLVQVLALPFSFWVA